MTPKTTVTILLIISFLIPSQTVYSLEDIKQVEESLHELLLFRVEPLSHQDGIQAARLLKKGTDAYIQELKKINLYRFKDINGDSAKILQNEIKDATESMEAMILWFAIIIKDSSQSKSLMAWHMVSRHISINIVYMDDIESRGLIKSKWNITLEMVLRGILDTIIKPKLEHLMDCNQAAKSINKK